jgi:hypothetical protein
MWFESAVLPQSVFSTTENTYHDNRMVTPRVRETRHSNIAISHGLDFEYSAALGDLIELMINCL